MVLFYLNYFMCWFVIGCLLMKIMCMCFDEVNGGWVIKWLDTKEQEASDVRIVVNVAKEIKLSDDYSFACKDLNSHRILLDRGGNASFGEWVLLLLVRGLVEEMKNGIDGYWWLALQDFFYFFACLTYWLIDHNHHISIDSDLFISVMNLTIYSLYCSI